LPFFFGVAGRVSRRLTGMRCLLLGLLGLSRLLPRFNILASFRTALRSLWDTGFPFLSSGYSYMPSFKTGDSTLARDRGGTILRLALDLLVAAGPDFLFAFFFAGSSDCTSSNLCGVSCRA